MSRPVPWVEKYRPRSVEDLVSQTEVVRALRNCVVTRNLPHLLFYGPPGTGKTSAILATARDLFGSEHMGERVLELNASDERGINVIRTKVKQFAQTAVSQAHKNMAPFKIIILDEADNMTAEAQAALRRTMEEYSKVTRFCIICNYISRIIDPIASRCAKFRFKPLPAEHMSGRLETVAASEGISLDSTTRDCVMQVSGGDLRKAITLLQSAARMFGRPTAAAVQYVGGVVPQDRVLDLARLLGSSKSSASVDDISRTLETLLADGYSGVQVLQQLHDGILSGEYLQNVPDKSIASLLIKIADKERLMGDGGNEFLQLLDLLCYGVRAA